MRLSALIQMKELQGGRHETNPTAILPLVAVSLMLNLAPTLRPSPQPPHLYAKANVPFSFTVARRNGRPGATDPYSVPGIAIRNCKTGATVFSLARQESPRDTAAKLIFDHVNNQYS